MLGGGLGSGSMSNPLDAVFDLIHENEALRRETAESGEVWYNFSSDPQSCRIRYDEGAKLFVLNDRTFRSDVVVATIIRLWLVVDYRPYLEPSYFFDLMTLEIGEIPYLRSRLGGVDPRGHHHVRFNGGLDIQTRDLIRGGGFEIVYRMGANRNYYDSIGNDPYRAIAAISTLYRDNIQARRLYAHRSVSDSEYFLDDMEDSYCGSSASVAYRFRVLASRFDPPPDTEVVKVVSASVSSILDDDFD